MKKEYIIRTVASSMVTAGSLLTYFVSIYWVILPLFVGINLIQSSFTKFCPLEKNLNRFNVK
ncbi:DUF2892 domain-containing protein [Bacteroidaceae bacterium HV4-6-C5C]|jgi:hypothetical protein|nr:DUF2892 domain-containing protein [Bacteroidaceae bacterium HV4-6-C5C]